MISRSTNGYIDRDDSLADVYRQIVRFGKDFAEKASSLDDFDWMKLFHGGATA